MQTRNRVRDDERHRIVSMYDKDGYTVEAIKNATGRYRSTIINILTKAGVYVPGEYIPREQKPQAKVTDAQIRQAFAQGFADATPHERSVVAHETARALA